MRSMRSGAGAGGGSSDPVNGLLEGGLAWFRHGPRKTQEEIDKERARSISNGAVVPVSVPACPLCLSAPASAHTRSRWRRRHVELAPVPDARPVVRDQAARRAEDRRRDRGADHSRLRRVRDPGPRGLHSRGRLHCHGQVVCRRAHLALPPRVRVPSQLSSCPDACFLPCCASPTCGLHEPGCRRAGRRQRSRYTSRAGDGSRRSNRAHAAAGGEGAARRPSSCPQLSKWPRGPFMSVCVECLFSRHRGTALYRANQRAPKITVFGGCSVS